MSTTAETLCPNCGAELVGGLGFVAWCRDCGWNAEPETGERQKLSRVDKWWSRKQNSLALRLASDVHTVADLRGGERVIRAAVWVMASVIHLLTIALLAAAIFVLTSSLWLVFKVILFVFLVGLFWTVQPFHRRRRIREPFVLERDTAPELFALVDEVAAAVGTTGVDRIEVSPAYNASYGKEQRRATLTIGLALWVVLTPEERVALLGHEMGHRVNGDLRELMFVHTALVSLSSWAQLIAVPGTPWWRRHAYARVNPDRGLVNLAELLVPVVLFPLTLLISAIAALLEILNQRQGQRAEYRADLLAAKAAGTPAAVALTEKLLISAACRRKLTHTARHERKANMWNELRNYVDTLPDSEWERLRRNARARMHRIDSTHPPSALRIDVLQRVDAQAPRCAVDAERMRRIDAELNRGAVVAAERVRSDVG